MSEDILKNFYQLISRYLGGDVSSEQQKIVDDYYNLFDDEIEITSRMTPEQVAAINKRIRTNIRNNTSAKLGRLVPFYKKSGFYKAAAILIVVSGLAMLIYKQQSSVSGDETAIVRNANVNRYLTLPDGSTVLVRSGSTFSLSKTFGQGLREVTLSGEAFFDIMDDPHRPFIIRTGKIKTTVLGTAFTIKSYPGQNNVIVTVTRGKVKVERQNQLVAIITSNKQVEAAVSQDAVQTKPKAIDPVSELRWAAADMKFDYKPFQEIVGLLEKRYDVKIKFRSARLADCKITGQFTGTESLSQVLDILSQTTNTNYTIQQNEVIIDGPGC